MNLFASKKGAHFRQGDQEDGKAVAFPFNGPRTDKASKYELRLLCFQERRRATLFCFPFPLISCLCQNRKLFLPTFLKLQMLLTFSSCDLLLLNLYPNKFFHYFFYFSKHCYNIYLKPDSIILHHSLVNSKFLQCFMLFTIFTICDFLYKLYWNDQIIQAYYDAWLLKQSI